jgi:hypothetical protein
MPSVGQTSSVVVDVVAVVVVDVVLEDDELVLEDDELVLEDDELVLEDDELVLEDDELVLVLEASVVPVLELVEPSPVVPLQRPECACGPPYGGGVPLWPSASHGGLEGGGLGVPLPPPPPLPRATPGRINIAVARIATAIDRRCFLLIWLPSRPSVEELLPACDPPHTWRLRPLWVGLLPPGVADSQKPSFIEGCPCA